MGEDSMEIRKLRIQQQGQGPLIPVLDLLQVQNAIDYLKTIGALDENENLTVLGCNLSMLPAKSKLGNMIILGVVFNCLDPVLTIVAGLSARDSFFMLFDKKDVLGVKVSILISNAHAIS
ncbi:hypothetical protein FXO38_34373 [Capsicum annuum]|uniref:RNA helicase n=1 Tax=Capsicum annuum TaxID=4072 RepID=A0A2G2ZGU1_CAPAN|nr:hypothetical protein FXO38_34373 [Capsicum annuum]KAF3618315.1 hypothetical protein FXO37_34245 [Capsicum annuum]PHT81213.1 hypothetical protein T459_14228 [Capsicum annuum]